MKFLKCIFKGHQLEKSIVNTINSNNWLKRCSRCGLYLMHGDIGKVILTKRQAMKIKKEFEKEFPYSVGKKVQYERIYR